MGVDDAVDGFFLSFLSPASARGFFFARLFCFAQPHSQPSACMHLGGVQPRNVMLLTSAECRERAAQKTAEAELQPRHQKTLRTAAEGWLILADLMERVEASLAAQSAEPAE
jgi:hypothetical protein